jgi:predicted dehydrogenase
VSIQEAATTTVGTIALQGVRRANPQLGERVCVLGLGLLGQLAMQMLRAAGCTVIGLDLDPRRVQVARGLGLEAGESDPTRYKAIVRDLTGGQGADCVIITAATKSDAVVNLSMEVCRAKGRVVIVGDVGLAVARAAFYRKEIDLLMSTSYGPGRYDRGYEEEGHDYPFAHVRWTLNRNMGAYLDLIAAKRLDVATLIESTVSIDEAHAAYQKLAEGGEDAPLAVLLAYPADPHTSPQPADATRIVLRGHRPTVTGPQRYCLVGAGAFGISMLVAQMERRRDLFFLRGVVSRNTTQGGNFARANQLEVLATDLDAVLGDPDFDLMVIATRHMDHAEKVVKCLKAGKHVFVEKPLALTWGELDSILTAYNALDKKPVVMVGFNRRFSPAFQTLKTALAGRRSPLIVTYRLNGGYIPPDSWIQNVEGGGRNLGEACHMYDCFRYLAGAKVVGIKASAIAPKALPYLRNDNFVATLSYDDGSIANLVYTALGPKQGLPKERIEIFCDGEAYLVDDFKSLTRCSDSTVLWSATAADKGHFEELCRLGDTLAQGGDPPIPFEEIIETTATALYVEDLLFGRGEGTDEGDQEGREGS